jgi:hypothetical protein
MKLISESIHSEDRLVFLKNVGECDELIAIFYKTLKTSRKKLEQI